MTEEQGLQRGSNEVGARKFEPCVRAAGRREAPWRDDGRAQ
jgi:hypothetical protein